MENESPVTLITGARKGIGYYLSKRYLERGHKVIGVSREASELVHSNYEHFLGDVGNEDFVRSVFSGIRKKHGKLDHLINNAGIASMNHSLTSPGSTLEKVFSTNVLGTFLFARESAKLMAKNQRGRIINFSTVAVPLKLQGESVYAASKAAVVSLTQILAKEYAPYGITVNAVGPTPIATDLIRSVPQDKIKALIAQQTIPRMGELDDIGNVVDFFMNPASHFITGQVLYLGGVS